ncbi:hypothetical protein QOL99_00885 [Deinococcus sp. MIMF12]|uniref:YbjN domain-containing protein n=1 Tax=Deinococcus rhizophilus TaxID=3049544 RepID=A0ABT7JCD7_9DEIO|nr:hypothetical protein [Deinococcus rhizophilus]MDL2342696.1 hypothetical protein [Deinococcus rhizophilus]
MTPPVMTPEDRFPAPPGHPHAPAVAAALEQLRFLLSGWQWQVYGDDLVAVLALRDEATSLRIWVREGGINLDVFCLRVPAHPHILTWVLAENYGQGFRARATRSEDDRVLIYVTADFPLTILGDLAQYIWLALESELRWRGRLMQVRIPEEPEGLSA